MTPFIEEVFLGEIAGQCRAAITAVKQANNLLQTGGGVGEIFEALDDFIDHSSRVSIMLWPTENYRNPQDPNNVRRQVRGHYLRENIGVQDGHVLEKRNLRNHLQHFDERLDVWASGEQTNYIDRNIGDLASSIQINCKTPPVLRNFDPVTKKYIFREDEYDLQEMANGIIDVFNKVGTRLDSLRPR